MRLTRSGPGATVIGAVAERPPPVAVTVPRPPFAPAVNMTAAPTGGWIVPIPAGATVHGVETVSSSYPDFFADLALLQ